VIGFGYEFQESFGALTRLNLVRQTFVNRPPVPRDRHEAEDDNESRHSTDDPVNVLVRAPRFHNIYYLHKATLVPAIRSMHQLVR
jgi:hypothetical protein